MMKKVDNRLNIKISSSDKAKIAQKAREKGLTLSAYIRMVLLEQKD